MRQILLGLTLLLLAVPAQGFAGDHGPSKSGSVCCPKCAAPCQPTVSKGTETKHCWDVECQPICIPKVTFPWQRSHGKGQGRGCDDCVQPKCGRVKYVKKLMRYEYECSVCKYNFNVDTHKNGKAEHKTLTAPAPPAEAEGGSDAGQVPPPPPVEARRRRVRTIPVGTHRTHKPVRQATTSTSSESFTEIMAGFFK